MLESQAETGWKTSGVLSHVPGLSGFSPLGCGVEHRVTAYGCTRERPAASNLCQQDEREPEVQVRATRSATLTTGDVFSAKMTWA